MTKKLNVAVIGTGAMGQHHTRVYSELDSCNLVAVCDNNEKTSHFFSKKYNINAYSDVDKLLDSEDIDLVSIAVPTIYHKETALKCIEKGVHVLIEKPIALSKDEAVEIINSAKKNNVKLMVGHIERFNPVFVELKKRLKEGQLGKLFRINVNRIGPFPSRIGDVGVVLDLSVHDIDLIRYLTGSEITEIYSKTRSKINTKHEDMLSAIISLSDDSIAVLNIDWVTPTNIRKFYLVGERGMFAVDSLSRQLRFYENADEETITEGNMIRYKINNKEPLKAEIEHMVDCVVNNKEPLISGEDALLAVEVAHQILEFSKK